MASHRRQRTVNSLSFIDVPPAMKRAVLTSVFAINQNRRPRRSIAMASLCRGGSWPMAAALLLSLAALRLKLSLGDRVEVLYHGLFLLFILVCRWNGCFLGESLSGGQGEAASGETGGAAARGAPMPDDSTAIDLEAPPTATVEKQSLPPPPPPRLLQTGPELQPGWMVPRRPVKSRDAPESPAVESPNRFSSLDDEGRGGFADQTGVEWARALLANPDERRRIAAAEFAADDADGDQMLNIEETLRAVERACARSGLGLPRRERCEELFGFCDKSGVGSGADALRWAAARLHHLCSRTGDSKLQATEFQTFFKSMLESIVRKSERLSAAEAAAKEAERLSGAAQAAPLQRFAEQIVTGKGPTASSKPRSASAGAGAGQGEESALLLAGGAAGEPRSGDHAVRGGLPTQDPGRYTAVSVAAERPPKQYYLAHLKAHPALSRTQRTDCTDATPTIVAARLFCRSSCSRTIRGAPSRETAGTTGSVTTTTAYRAGYTWC